MFTIVYKTQDIVINTIKKFYMKISTDGDVNSLWNHPCSRWKFSQHQNTSCGRRVNLNGRKKTKATNRPNV